MESESRSQQISSTNDIIKQIPLLPTQGHSAELEKNEDRGLNVSQFLAVLRRRWLIIAVIFGTITAATLFISLRSKESYVSYINLLPETSTGENQLLSSVSGTLESQSQGDSATASSSSRDETQENILKSPKLLSPVIATLMANYPDMKAKNSDQEYMLFVQDLTVKKIENTRIIHVEYKNSNQNKVKDAINLLSKAYLDYSLQERQKEVRQGLKFLENQLPSIEAQVETLQARLQEFRQQYNLVDPTTQGQQISNQKSTFAEQRLNAQSQLTQAKALYADLKKQLAVKPSMASGSPLTKDARYQENLKKMQDLESQIAQESSLFRTDSANVKVLRDQQRNLMPLLTQQRNSVLRDLASQILETQNQLNSISEAENTLNKQVDQYAVLARYYDDLQRKLKIATDNLSVFLSKREALRIEVAQQEIPWQLLTPPTIPKIASKLLLKLLLGSTLGLLLGMGTAVFLDYSKNALHTAEDIEGITRVPVLGVIPFNKSLKKLISRGHGIFSDPANSTENFDFPLNNGKQMNDLDSDTYLEIFRSLYINTRFLRPGNLIRSLVVTSAVSGAGSSTVAMHLARAAAMMGQRVLLVDANLQSPELHTWLGLDNTLGLGNLITTDISLDRAIQRLPLSAALNPSLEPRQLFVLTSGQALQDPTILLSSPKMQVLQQALQAEFDLVIYDTSSLAEGVDSSLTATATDGLLMVVSLGHTSHPELSQAFNRIKHSPVSVLGIVANGAKATSVRKRSRRSSRTLTATA